MVFLIINRQTREIVDSFEIKLETEPSEWGAIDVLKQHTDLSKKEYMCDGTFVSYFYRVEIINPTYIKTN